VVPDGIFGAAREISVPIFEPHPKIGAEIDREAPYMPATRLPRTIGERVGKIDREAPQESGRTWESF